MASRAIRVPSIDECVRRYVVGSIKSALNLSRYWKEKGLSEPEAEQRALNQAMGMIASGYGNDVDKAKKAISEIRYWCDKLLSEIEPDCTRCPFIPCLNQFRQDEVRADAGGELKIFRSTLDDPLGLTIYHNTGGVLGSMEDIIIGNMDDITDSVIFIHMFLWYVLRDLMASAFLALCGRYRQAFSTLRSALEIMIVGVYFQGLNNDEFNETFEKEWRGWWEGKYKLFSKSLKYAVNSGFLSKNYRMKAGKLWGILSKPVHTPLKGDYEMVFEKDFHLARTASSFYNVDFLKEWFNTLLEIIIIMKEVITAFPFRHSDRSKEGFKLLDLIIKTLKRGYKGPLPFAECARAARVQI